MISPGLLGSGPVRTVIDMLNSANGCVTASDVLAGLVEGRGDEGAALATDFFAALVAAVAGAAGREAGRGDSGGASLRSQVSRCRCWVQVSLEKLLCSSLVLAATQAVDLL